MVGRILRGRFKVYRRRIVLWFDEFRLLSTCDVISLFFVVWDRRIAVGAGLVFAVFCPVCYRCSCLLSTVSTSVSTS